MAPLGYQSPLGADPAWRAGSKDPFRVTVGSLSEMQQHQPYYTSPFHKVQVAASNRQPCSITISPFNSTLNRHPVLHQAVQFICLVCVLTVAFLLLRKVYTHLHASRIRLGDEEAPRPTKILTRKGLRPGQSIPMPSVPVLLVPEGATFDMPREGCFVIPVKD